MTYSPVLPFVLVSQHFLVVDFCGWPETRLANQSYLKKKKVELDNHETEALKETANTNSISKLLLIIIITIIIIVFFSIIGVQYLKSTTKHRKYTLLEKYPLDSIVQVLKT